MSTCTSVISKVTALQPVWLAHLPAAARPVHAHAGMQLLVDKHCSALCEATM